MGSPGAATTEPQASNDGIGLSSSASSSSGLNTLSSRRLRPSLQKHTVQENLDENPPLAARSAVEATLSRAQKFTRGLFFMWTWFCLAHFTIVLFNTLQQTVFGWRDNTIRPVSGLEDPMSSPEAMLATLSLEHRMSKLSSLYPTPVSFTPFVLGPRRHEHNPVAACVWLEETGLSRLHTWVSSWQGPVSLIVTTCSEPHSPAHKKLLTTLNAHSHSSPNISFHVLHTTSSLRNFNAYINLARLFSPSSQVLLFPPHAMSTWSPLPISSATIPSIAVLPKGGLIIPMRQQQTGATLNGTTPTDLSRVTYLPSSALLLNRDSAPWCSERLFTMTERRPGHAGEPSGLDTEIAAHWAECTWNIWLRMKGAMHAFDGVGWATTEMAPLPAALENVETTISARFARKQRSETCVLVARELIAQGEWTEPTPSSGSVDVTNSAAPPGMDLRERRIRSHAKESLKAQWLRGICKETLDRWGKEILD